MNISATSITHIFRPSLLFKIKRQQSKPISPDIANNNLNHETALLTCLLMPTRTYSNIVIAIIATRVNDSAVRSVLATSHCLFLFSAFDAHKIITASAKSQKKSTRLVWVWVSSIENNRQNNPREIQGEREASTSKESEQAMNGHRERTYTRTERD